MRITLKIAIVFLVCVIVSFQSGRNIFLKVSSKLNIWQSTQIPPQSFLSLNKMMGHPEHYRVDQDVKIKGKKHLLLLATTRTGSSFVGEFFNQEKDMSYLYEPLWHVERTLTLGGRINVTATARAYPDVLRQLFLCDFSLLETFMNPFPADHITTRFFRRDASSSLCEDSVCSPVVKGAFESHRCKTKACGPLNLTKASESCLRKKHRVIKVVRVHRFHILQPLAEDASLDIKFIQLVRDPRAVVASRMLAFGRYKSFKKWAPGEDAPFDESDLKMLKTNCDTVRVSAELGLSQPPWLQRRYMLVRYEDIACSPMKKAAEMYQFSGIPFTPQIKSWILRSTLKEAKGTYSTQRNSSEHIDKWRFQLPFKVVQVIQTVCESTIRLFGYKFVTSEKMLKDNSVSLIENKDFNNLWMETEVNSQ